MTNSHVVEVTLTPSAKDQLGAVSISKDVMTLWPGVSTPQALDISRAMLNGGTWSPPYREFDRFLAATPRFSGIFTVKIIENRSWDTLESRVQIARNMYHQQLLELGAKGNAAAAIEYCELKLAGKIHDPVAFASAS